MLGLAKTVSKFHAKRLCFTELSIKLMSYVNVQKKKSAFLSCILAKLC